MYKIRKSVIYGFVKTDLQFFLNMKEGSRKPVLGVWSAPSAEAVLGTSNTVESA